MGDNRFNHHTYTSFASAVEEEGPSVTMRGEQRHKEGRGLDPLVDPKGYGAIRRSLPRLEKRGSHFVMLVGPPILKETRFDTTGSMGGNVDLAFKALPDSYRLLHEIKNAPLGRYDLQIINGIFGDKSDDYILCRSQAEMDIKIAEQLTLMVPEKAGGDSDEDPQYGIFGAAYLTAAHIVQYGLKSYDFTVTDARGRERIEVGQLKRVFGDDVFDRVADNGHKIDSRNVPTTKKAVQDLLKIAHAFLIQVGARGDVYSFWADMYGPERVITVPDVHLLPAVEAAVIGLTEGTIDLQTVKDFLVKGAGLSTSDADSIKRAVAKIPLGAQAALPNFDRLPKKGDRFASKTDVWPIGSGGVASLTEEDADTAGTEGEKSMWT